MSRTNGRECREVAMTVRGNGLALAAILVGTVLHQLNGQAAVVRVPVGSRGGSYGRAVRIRPQCLKTTDDRCVPAVSPSIEKSLAVQGGSPAPSVCVYPGVTSRVRVEKLWSPSAVLRTVKGTVSTTALESPIAAGSIAPPVAAPTLTVSAELLPTGTEPVPVPFVVK